jgi:hypothetical protein
MYQIKTLSSEREVPDGGLRFASTNAAASEVTPPVILGRNAMLAPAFTNK